MRRTPSSSAFLLSPLQHQTPRSPAPSVRLWYPTKKTHSWTFYYIPVPPCWFTRWQSSPQCLCAAGITSKRGAPMWTICMALMLSPARAFKALCLFHMSQTSLITPALSQLEPLNAHPLVWLCGNQDGGGQGLGKLLNANLLELVYVICEYWESYKIKSNKTPCFHPINI